MKRKSFRDYLKLNGIPLRYDLNNREDLLEYREKEKNYYGNIYNDIEFKTTDKILEVGTHYGGFVKLCNHFNIIPDAIDLDENKINLLKKDEDIKANLYHADIVDFAKNRNEEYDYIFLNFVLEHIEKNVYIEALRNIQKALKFGGKLFVTVPNMENPFNLRLRYFEATHVNGFTTESLIWAFYMGGLDNIECLDLHSYTEEKREQIEDYFKRKAEFFEIRPFHGKFSENILCKGVKVFNLEELSFGPYDS